MRQRESASAVTTHRRMRLLIVSLPVLGSLAITEEAPLVTLACLQIAAIYMPARDLNRPCRMPPASSRIWLPLFDKPTILVMVSRR
jgi:hypothetical protein